MRSRFVVCAALAGIGLLGAWSPVRAADPKAKAAKKKSADSLSDDKVIDKQLQWEDSVMGPDDKRGELDKIARAQAINKAASEKAEREKEKAAAAAAKEPPAPKAQTSKRGGEVALPTLPDEDSGSGKNAKGKASEISPKLETTAAAAPPPPVKHGDDKFIDKLLKDEPASKKKRASAGDDKALDDLLAVDKPAKPAAKGKGKRSDDVDSLLDSAEKAPPMPETKVKHETPEWAKPEIESTPVAAPIAVRPQPKRNDGIIHVVQGAAPTRPVAPISTTRTQAPARPAAYATRAPAPAPALSPAARRQQTPARPASWNDPFADAPKKTVAARETRGSADDDDFSSTPVRRRASAPQPPSITKAEANRSARGARSSDRGSDNDWSDPFKDSAKTTNTRRAAPAKPAEQAPAHRAGWKDPFTQENAGARATHTTVAMREPRKGEADKWEVAGKKKSTPAVGDAAPVPAARGRWGVLKKHAH
jgi:hypothetical protein